MTKQAVKWFCFAVCFFLWRKSTIVEAYDLGFQFAHIGIEVQNRVQDEIIPLIFDSEEYSKE